VVGARTSLKPYFKYREENEPDKTRSYGGLDIYSIICIVGDLYEWFLYEDNSPSSARDLVVGPIHLAYPPPASGWWWRNGGLGIHVVLF
jgi:hypothetical protein